MQDEIIYHHGIKGMKWGVRRYQNEDGSLTPAGKKRISKEYKKVSDKVVKELNKTASKRYVDSYNKAADYMNSEGIRKFNAAQEKNTEKTMKNETVILKTTKSFSVTNLLSILIGLLMIFIAQIKTMQNQKNLSINTL